MGSEQKVRIRLGGVTDSISRHRVWVETFSRENKPSDVRWAFGACLFSPQNSVSGADIYREMRAVSRGDWVLHHDSDLRAIVAVSRVADGAEAIPACPDGTKWAGRLCCRVPLAGLRVLQPPLANSQYLGHTFEAQLAAISEQAELRRSMAKLKQLHYAEKRRRTADERQLKQGAYLTEAPPLLQDHLNLRFHALTGLPLFTEPVQADDGPSIVGIRLALGDRGTEEIVLVDSGVDHEVDDAAVVDRPEVICLDGLLFSRLTKAVQRLGLLDLSNEYGESSAPLTFRITVSMSDGVDKIVDCRSDHFPVELWAARVLIDAVAAMASGPR